jgi:hypothetical protein
MGYAPKHSYEKEAVSGESACIACSTNSPIRHGSTGNACWSAAPAKPMHAEPTFDPCSA